MNLIEMANMVCEKVGKVDPESIAACRQFLQQRHELLVQSGLWKDTLDFWNVAVVAGQETVVLPIEVGRPLGVWDTAENKGFDIDGLASVVAREPAKLKSGGGGFQSFAEVPAVGWPFDLLKEGSLQGSQVSFVNEPRNPISVIINIVGVVHFPTPFDHNAQVSQSYQLQPGQTVITPNPWVRIDALTKPQTPQVIGCRQMVTNQYWIWPGDSTKAVYPRVRLMPPINRDATLGVFGKRVFRQMNLDTDPPMVRGLANALMGFAQADMLERSRQYGKAASKAQESSALVALARDEDINQSAQEARIVPDVAYLEGTEEWLGWR